MTGKVLVVDDNETLVDITCALLTGSGYAVRGCTDIREALSVFSVLSPDVCVLDYHMPQMLGGELARLFKAQDPAVEIIFLTGEDQPQLVIELMKGGAIDYLVKPVAANRLYAAIHRALEHRRLVLENLSYRNHLEVRVAEQTQALSDSLRQLERLSTTTLDTLGMALDFRDQSTSGHSRRVMTQTGTIARKIGISGSALLPIEHGAFLHDLGKLKIPDSILLKPGKLLSNEWETMRRHSEYGRDFMLQIDFLADAADLAYSHHEKFDGSGYPRGLRGEAIPIGARIFAVVDAMDAMTFPRPYSQPTSIEKALEELARCSGSHFDPEIVRVVLDHPFETFGLPSV